MGIRSVLLTAVAICLLTCGAFAQEAASDSFTFSQPIPVTIRMSNNAIVQVMLLGLDQDGISVMSPQGKQLKYEHKKVKSVASADRTFFYNPSKDNLGEVIERLNKLQPQSSTPAGTNTTTTTTGQPFAGNAGGATVPFTVGGARPGGGHSQSSMPPGFGVPNANNAATSAASMMAHSQAGRNSTMPMPTTTTTTMPTTTMPTTTTPFGGHSQTTTTPFTTSTMPSAGHSSMPSMSTMPSMNRTTPMPNMGHMPTPGSSMPGPSFPSQGMFQYECMKCKYTFTTSGEMKAGGKCPKCGVTWDHVQDEHGRITSTSKAKIVGGGVAAVITIVGVIVAIARRANA